ncbi:MAG: hypothetical protein HKN25_08725 [Pyrinomonadaceae bacterium]|nr:hypothetical protein [Pyrinomonadaceae bacterium]
MNESVQNLLLAPAGLYIPLLIALLLTFTRSPHRDSNGAPVSFVGAFLIGIAIQCAHFIEEFITGFHILFPTLFGLTPVSAELFVGFNVSWLGIWSLAAFGIIRGVRVAYFPVWFFGLAMSLNGVAHPILSVWTGGYFPGLFTSPAAGIIGIVITTRLFRSTASWNNNASDL